MLIKNQDLLNEDPKLTFLNKFFLFNGLESYYQNL